MGNSYRVSPLLELKPEPLRASAFVYGEVTEAPLRTGHALDDRLRCPDIDEVRVCPL
ncbi:hypothetical protein ABO01nite_05090 [Asaia bogorensis NBRC 16594]|uniref:Uncharacterized protein n=1 Tax=Asaia bogorensis NBRC 16594 TaxID=1231624 RepID=A0AAN4R1K3_9PROT|nr:hypothetical protein ABO01nite_05090 [Asaia bogorensis NBRC 16594]